MLKPAWDLAERGGTPEASTGTGDRGDGSDGSPIIRLVSQLDGSDESQSSHFTAASGYAGGGSRRVVVVSNRVANPDGEQRAGGLAVTLRDAFRERRGLWFGWSGEVHEDAAARPTHRRAAATADLATIDFSPAEYEGCYLGYANRCLWPALHYRADLVEFDPAYLESYRATNRRFAERLSPLLRPGDLIWVHDYHLIPLARELRRLGHRQPIGFFLHVPFPAPPVLATLPGHEELLECFSEYDLVGFQTRQDARCFRDSMAGLVGGGVRGDLIEAFGRRTRTGAFPVGIDVAEFAALAEAPQGCRQTSGLRRSLQGRDLIVGVDRLDYTKGLGQRFAAYRRLLEQHSERRDRVTLLQIAPLSREEVDAYAAEREELDRLAGEINGAFGELDWTPIRYHVKPLARAKLAGVYRASRVGLVTPLRDGMNLVAKEYVAAQDPADPGVLVLSRFAGAAERLEEALTVNPYDVPATAEAIERALSMSLEERQRRHRALLRRVREDDAASWSRRFLAALAGTVPANAGNGLGHGPEEPSDDAAADGLATPPFIGPRRGNGRAEGIGLQGD